MTNLSYGLTKVHLDTRMGEVVVYHGGNMGNTVERSVRPNVDKLLGEGVFDKLREAGIEDGSPDYSYTLTAPLSAYLEVKES